LKLLKKKKKTVGGLVLASAAKEKPQTAKVVAVGEGNVLENGQKSPMPVAVGDMVMFEKYAGTEVKYEGNEYLIIAAKDIMAIVE
jgi:chaperonin GroES